MNKISAAVVGAAVALPGLAHGQTMSGFELPSSVQTDVVSQASQQYFPVIVGLLASVAGLLIIIAAIRYGKRFVRWVAHRLIGV